jgi:acylphosphatase
MPTTHLLIKGIVQGVFFRATAKKVADKFGITGWVKNTDAGFVEAMISGSKDATDQFISWCRQGPEKAEVTEVIITSKPETDFKEFEVIRRRS